MYLDVVVFYCTIKEFIDTDTQNIASAFAVSQIREIYNLQHPIIMDNILSICTNMGSYRSTKNNNCYEIRKKLTNY